MMTRDTEGFWQHSYKAQKTLMNKSVGYKGDAAT